MKDPNLIDHLAKLAKLSFSEEEQRQMQADMERIMRLMDTITQVDISEEDYPLRAEDGMELLREDAVAPSLPAEEILGNAKGRLYNFIAVTKLMD